VNGIVPFRVPLSSNGEQTPLLTFSLSIDNILSVDINGKPPDTSHGGFIRQWIVSASSNSGETYVGL
jgi:hypothetical protein